MKKHFVVAFLAIILLVTSGVYAEHNIQKGDLIENKDGSIWAVTKSEDHIIYIVPYLGGREDIILSSWVKKGNGHVHKYGSDEHCKKAADFMRQ